MYVLIIIYFSSLLLLCSYLLFSGKAQEYLKEKEEVLSRNDVGKKLRGELEAGMYFFSSFYYLIDWLLYIAIEKGKAVAEKYKADSANKAAAEAAGPRVYGGASIGMFLSINSSSYSPLFSSFCHYTNVYFFSSRCTSWSRYWSFGKQDSRGPFHVGWHSKIGPKLQCCPSWGVHVCFFFFFIINVNIGF